MSNCARVLQATQTSRVAECALRSLPVFVSLYNTSGRKGLQAVHTHRAAATCLSVVVLLTADCQFPDWGCGPAGQFAQQRSALHIQVASNMLSWPATGPFLPTRCLRAAFRLRLLWKLCLMT